MKPYLSHIAEHGAERPLEFHLRSVGATAARFARPFGAEWWGMVAGLWHDLGKFQSRWQAYLRSQYADSPHEAEPRGSVPHSLAGAQYAEQVLPNGLGRLLAYVIAGHHAGLPDFHPSEAGYGSLKLRLDEAARNPSKDELGRAFENRAAIPADILEVPALSPDLARMTAEGRS
ncbi:MAG: CRISPR-associated endonuclease Cas3'' [Pseudomonadota bacterium]